MAVFTFDQDPTITLDLRVSHEDGRYGLLQRRKRELAREFDILVANEVSVTEIAEPEVRVMTQALKVATTDYKGLKTWWGVVPVRLEGDALRETTKAIEETRQCRLPVTLSRHVVDTVVLGSAMRSLSGHRNITDVVNAPTANLKMMYGVGDQERLRAYHAGVVPDYDRGFIDTAGRLWEEASAVVNPQIELFTNIPFGDMAKIVS